MGTVTVLVDHSEIHQLDQPWGKPQEGLNCFVREGGCFRRGAGELERYELFWVVAQVGFEDPTRGAGTHLLEQHVAPTRLPNGKLRWLWRCHATLVIKHT